MARASAGNLDGLLRTDLMTRTFADTVISLKGGLYSERAALKESGRRTHESPQEKAAVVAYQPWLNGE